jgi:hypothetical protein
MCDPVLTAARLSFFKKIPQPREWELILAASVVVAFQAAMRSFRVINDASTARSRPPHYSRNALSQSRNDAVVRPCVYRKPYSS